MRQEHRGGENYLLILRWTVYRRCRHRELMLTPFICRRVGASNYTYAEARCHKTLPEGSSRITMLRILWLRTARHGPDNLKSGVSKAVSTNRI